MNATANGEAPPQTGSSGGFQVHLTNFEGPFDLLLQLIFAHRLDVTEVALHQVTDDFIAYTREIGAQLDLEETTAFLVVAATLLDLKAARLLPAGRMWDVLILGSDLGHPTLDVLTRLVDRPGPVLADFGDARIGFFVPPGTAARWLGTGVRGVGRGTWIVVPYPGRPTGGVRWLVPPDGTGHLTDPVVLELAMHEAAAQLAGG